MPWCMEFGADTKKNLSYKKGLLFPLLVGHKQISYKKNVFDSYFMLGLVINRSAPQG